MKIQYCLPVIKDIKKQVLQALNTKGYDYYEVWLDYIEDLDDGFVINLAKEFKGRIIFVFRRQHLEKIQLNLNRRLRIISLLSRFNVFLDIDFFTQQEELDFLRQKNSNIKLILSYHNYKETPKLDYLVNLINKMKRYHPNLFKVATFCQNREDSLILLNLLLLLKKQNKKFIILGMGQNSQVTRIFGAVWGNEINFAPVTLKEKSAQGQLTKKQLDNILKELNYGR